MCSQKFYAEDADKEQSKLFKELRDINICKKLI